MFKASELDMIIASLDLIEGDELLFSRMLGKTPEGFDTALQVPSLSASTKEVTDHLLAQYRYIKSKRADMARIKSKLYQVLDMVEDGATQKEIEQLLTDISNPKK